MKKGAGSAETRCRFATIVSSGELKISADNFLGETGILESGPGLGHLFLAQNRLGNTTGTDVEPEQGPDDLLDA